MLLGYKYRLYPNRAQREALAAMLGDFCSLYNAALQQRIEAYRRRGIALRYVDQSLELKATRQADEGLSRWSFTAENQVLRRLDKAFRGFFGRVRAGRIPGYPRFRSRHRFHSADFRVGDGLTIRKSDRLGFVGVPGEIKVKWHRQLPSKPKHAILSRQCGKWYIVLQVEVAHAAARQSAEAGIDVGLLSLAALSTGEVITRPNWTKRASAGLRRRQRALQRTRLGSKRRAKTRERLARYYRSIANRRDDMLHKLSASLVRRFSHIAIERLNYAGLSRGILARDIHDAAWKKLGFYLRYKAEKAGGELIEVDPRGTSQTCPDCGVIKAKALSERVHRCECGCELDRDVAAAKIIHMRAFGPGTGLRTPSQRSAA